MDPLLLEGVRSSGELLLYTYFGQFLKKIINCLGTVSGLSVCVIKL